MQKQFAFWIHIIFKFQNSISQFPFLWSFISPSCLHGYISNHLLLTLAFFYDLPKSRFSLKRKAPSYEVKNACSRSSFETARVLETDMPTVSCSTKPSKRGFPVPTSTMTCAPNPRFAHHHLVWWALNWARMWKTYPAGWTGAACWPRASFYGRPCD